MCQQKRRKNEKQYDRKKATTYFEFEGPECGQIVLRFFLLQGLFWSKVNQQIFKIYFFMA